MVSKVFTDLPPHQVGLTPDEELELAMLKSRVAEEEPDESPRAPPAYPSNYSGQVTAARALPYAPGGMLNPSAPLVMALPSLVPLRGAARGPARGSTPALIEGLLGSDHLGDAPLGPLVASHARSRPQDHPGLAPPAPPAAAAAATAGAAYQPPVAMPAMAAAAPVVVEDDWDDVDRPLFGGGVGGNCGGGSGGYVDSGSGSGVSGGGYGKLD